MDSKGNLRRGIGGIDEAGRGPMFGPLVVCGVLANGKAIAALKELGVRDSKTLSTRQRERMEQSIRGCIQSAEYVIISASEIDRRRQNRVTLNEMEVGAFVDVAKRIAPTELYLDAADVNSDRFGKVIGERSGLLKRGCKIVSEHQADERYTIVAAASILAKVRRDSEIARLHERYGNFGSGYPSDPKSIRYLERMLEENRELPTFIRSTWKSVSKRIEAKGSMQSTLED